MRRRHTRTAGDPTLVGGHARLEVLLDAVASACRGSRREHAHAAAVHLHDGLEAHLEREERLYFPPIAALRPERGDGLAHLLQAHEAIRAHVRLLCEHLARDEARAGAGDDAGADLAAGERALADLRRRLAEHEEAEERFLDQLEAELREAATGSEQAPG